MFATRNSARGNYTYLVEVERAQVWKEGQRYTASVVQIVDHSIGDRIAHHPRLRRQCADSPEEAIAQACSEADRLIGQFTSLPEVAALVFDSEQAPVPVGIRAGKAGPRKLLYATGGHLIDLQVQPADTGTRSV